MPSALYSWLDHRLGSDCQTFLQPWSVPEGHPDFLQFPGKAVELFYYQISYSSSFKPMFETLLTHHPFTQSPAFCSGVLSIFQSSVKKKKKNQIGIYVAIKAGCPK